MKRLLGTILVIAAIAAPAAAATPHTGLPGYLKKVTAQVRAYRTLEYRLGDVLSRPPIANVDPTVDALNALASEFDRLAQRWYPIARPHGLIARHRQMGKGFELQAEAWRVYAAALYTRHRDEIAAASVHVKALLSSAVYAQRRWAAALRGALVRARIRVPEWLHGMATGP